MKKLRVVSLVVLALLIFTSIVSADMPDASTFHAHAAGKNEVPARPSRSQGQAVFHLNADETALAFKLVVSNIRNVTASHIHCGAVGVNGPVGVTLYMGAVNSGKVTGVLSDAVITAPDAGNACGWVTLSDVVTAMRSGNTYVNIHTNDGVAPTNTGPGDFPGGEIRGQIVGSP